MALWQNKIYCVGSLFLIFPADLLIPLYAAIPANSQKTA